MPTLHEFLLRTAARLAAAGIDSPRLSAEILLAHALGISRNALLKALIVNPNLPLGSLALTRVLQLTSRREAGEPVAYLTGIKEFYGRDFRVTPATLIPRPETELLVDEAKIFAASYRPEMKAPFHFADMGTGSGCIAVTLALELGEDWRGHAVDVSPDALAVARENARTLKAPYLEFLEADFTRPVFGPASLDLFISNPPYISETEYKVLSHEVRDFEPKTALVPPVLQADGLEHGRILIREAARALRPGGMLLLECAHTQGDALLQRLAARPGTWAESCVLTDLAGLPRILRAVRARLTSEKTDDAALALETEIE